MKRLIIGPAWVGDMVMAQALALRLKASDPTGDIHIVGPAATLPLVERMVQITHSWLLDITHGKLELSKRWQLAKALRAEAFDEAIVLPRSYKAALVPFLAGIPRRIGAVGEMRYGLITHAVRLPRNTGRTVDEFVRYAGDSEMVESERPQLTLDAEHGALLNRFGISTARPKIALCPGAEYGPSKRWPAAHFAALAKKLIARDIEVMVVGGPKDRELGHAISKDAASPLLHDVTGKTTLLEAVDLLASAQVIVTNDSGLMHIAAALARPLVALYGSSSPVRTPPLTAQARILHTDISCRPCYARTCPLLHTDCLVKLDVALVEAAVLASLNL